MKKLGFAALAAGAIATSALALVACSPKTPPGRTAPAPGPTQATSPASVVQKTSPHSDAEIAKSEDAFAIAKIAAADFIVANPDAPDEKAVAVATSAAQRAGDPDAKDTGESAASDAKGWIATRRANGFPPRTTPTELAANDAVADAADRKEFAEMSPTDRKSVGPILTEPGEPSRGAHYFPKIGTCFNSQVATIGSRLENTPDSGDAVTYTDGHYQTSYESSPVVQQFHVGDPVRLCVTDLPGHCPPADDRGISFVAVDDRTGGRWEASDSEHGCGGA